MPRSSSEESLSLELPVLGPGTRVDVLVEGNTLICRAARMQGQALYLTVGGNSVRYAALCAPGTPLQLTMYRAGSCWEFEATIREWVWTQPAMLVVGGLKSWTQKQRRQEQREPRSLEALLQLPHGERICGRTLDISAGGVSLLLPATESLKIEQHGQLTLRLADDEWCRHIPVCITRLENWLHPRGRSQKVGAALAESATLLETERWSQCRERLNALVTEEETNA